MTVLRLNKSVLHWLSLSALCLSCICFSMGTTAKRGLDMLCMQYGTKNKHLCGDEMT